LCEVQLSVAAVQYR